jgi:hypothetical protein
VRLPRFWKHSRQYTGFPAVGLKGTWVSLPHSEQTAENSGRAAPLSWDVDMPPPPLLPFRAARQLRQRVGSF